MKTTKESYCVNGTSVRNGHRFEITNKNVFISKQEAEKTKDTLKNLWGNQKNKEYTFKNLHVSKRNLQPV